MRLLSFDGAVAWGDVIEQETEKDVRQIRIAGMPISVGRAKRFVKSWPVSSPRTRCAPSTTTP